MGTFVLMACATQSTRLSGYLLFRKRQIGARTQAIIENEHGCVLITLLVPNSVAGDPAGLTAMAAGVLVARRFFSGRLFQGACLPD
ncbi:AzlD domain-containing protein [Rhizobium bangladeshense]|nr:AzlD domain-containing protein [Rhizobium bangladeshense]